jgi:hypothetical protein
LILPGGEVPDLLGPGGGLVTMYTFIDTLVPLHEAATVVGVLWGALALATTARAVLYVYEHIPLFGSGS